MQKGYQRCVSRHPYTRNIFPVCWTHSHAARRHSLSIIMQFRTQTSFSAVEGGKELFINLAVSLGGNIATSSSSLGEQSFDVTHHYNTQIITELTYFVLLCFYLYMFKCRMNINVYSK